MELQNFTIDIDQFFSRVRETLQDLRVHIREKVLFNIRTDFRLPTTDTQDQATRGHTVFGPSDECLNNIDAVAFLGALLNDGRLCHRRPDGRVVWDIRQVNQWLADIHRSWSDIYCLLHILTLSGRGTEEAFYQWANSAESRRHLFLVRHITAIISNYHKGHQVTGLYKQILRLIPNELGFLMAILLRIVRPIEATVVGHFFTPAARKSRMKNLYSSRILVTYGQEWDSTRLSLLLKTWWMKNMQLPFALNLHRQFSVGLQRQFLAYRNADPRATVAQEAFAHGEKADEMNYAKMRGDPAIPLSRQTLFEAVCKDWLALFQFHNPEKYRVSLWDDSDIFFNGVAH
jgi:hypothetical protein